MPSTRHRGARRSACKACKQSIRSAAYAIGLGPKFETGSTADAAVETAWGEDLGKVLWSGRTCDLEGEPQEIQGHARDRYVYAPCADVFSTGCSIGDSVVNGQEIARIGELQAVRKG